MTGSTSAHQQYAGHAGREYHQGKRGLPAGALAWVVESRARRFHPLVKSTDRILEFGVGAGWNLAGLQCRRRVGHDVERHLAEGPEFAGIEFTADTSSLPAGSFEVLLCHHALEHVDEPARVLVELKRLAAPGGRLLLAVPFECERRYRRYNPNEPNHHLYSWTVQSLGHLVTVTGWQVQEIGLKRYGYDRLGGAWAVRLKLGHPGFLAIRGLVRLLRPLLEIVIVARKG